jgi:hypothetical protein
MTDDEQPDSDEQPNSIDVVGLRDDLQKVIDSWEQVVDANGLRDTPPMIMLGVPPEMAAVNTIRIGVVRHEPGVGEALLDRLRTAVQELPLGLEHEVAFSPSFYFKIDMTPGDPS